MRKKVRDTEGLEVCRAYLKSCEDFRVRLIRNTRRVVKNKQPYGTEILLNFDPKFFQAYNNNVIQLWNISDGKARVNNYDPNIWYAPFCMVESTKKRYHPSYKNLCPVLHNADNNPIILKEIEGLPQASYINHINTKRYKNNDVSILIHTTLAVLEDGVLELIPNDSYELFLPEEGQPTFEVNGRLSHRVDHLIDMFDLLCSQFLYSKGYSLHKDYMVIHRLLDQHLPHWFANRYLSTATNTIPATLRAQLDKLRASPLLYDLPYTEIQLMNLYNDARYDGLAVDRKAQSDSLIGNILKHLENGDTKSATAGVFHGNNYPSSIKKVLLKTDPLQFNTNCYHAIAACVKNIGVDKTRIFITKVGSDNLPDYDILNSEALLTAFSLGWNVGNNKQPEGGVKNKLQYKNLRTKRRLVQDSFNMYSRLKTQEVALELPSNNIKEIHDYLSPIFTLYRRAESSAEMTAMKTVDTSSQLKRLQTQDYIVRSPVTAYELMEVGTQMRHCVASYAGRFFYRQIEIALLTDREGEYLVCLEIYDGKVVQAKMKFNKPVCQNDEYLDIVMDFIAFNDLEAATSDIESNYGEYHYYYDYNTPQDQQRVDIVAEFRKEAAADINLTQSLTA